MNKELLTHRIIALNDLERPLTEKETISLKRYSDELDGIYMAERNQKDREWLRFMASRE